MKDKPWLALPFLGSSRTNEPERETSTSQAGNPRSNGPEIEYELSRQATVKDFAEMREEDIVQDYNSPIHMWVSIVLV